MGIAACAELGRYRALIFIAVQTIKFYFHIQKSNNTILREVFLALLDYVSRAHEIAVCLSSVVRPSMSPLSLNLTHGSLQIFGCGFPWSIRSGVF